MKTLLGVLFCGFMVSFSNIVLAKEYKCVNVSKIESTESDGPEIKIIGIGKKEFIIEVISVRLS